MNIRYKKFAAVGFVATLILGNLVTPSMAATKYPSFATKTFSGTGDDVVLYEISKIALVTFSCVSCSDNTVLKTDGAERLLVNEIGPHTGTYLINSRNGSLTTSFEINADSDWTLKIASVNTAPKVSSKSASGSGSTILNVSSKFRAMKIKAISDSNFVVYNLQGSYKNLLVNEIGSYLGTVRVTTPGLVQIISTGTWQITFVS